jgi:PAS domain-containing protein
MLKLKRGFPLAPYLVAIVATAVATAVTLAWPALLDLHSMAAYMIVVVIVASYGGLGPSIVAITLSGLAFAYFVAPPKGISIADPQDKFRLLSFVVIALLFSFLHSTRIKAERRANSMMQRLSLALEGTKLGVWDLNLGTGVVWHSDSLEEIFGREGDRFSRAYEVFIGYIHPEDRDFVHRTVTHSVENGEEFHIQYRILLPDGQARSVATRGRVFFDSKGHPERLVATTTDMTNRAGASLAPAAARIAPAQAISSDMTAPSAPSPIRAG